MKETMYPRNEDPIVSTRQALRILSATYPGFKTAPQLMRQVRIGALRVAAVHGKKYYFRLSDVLALRPRYEKQGRNSRPPTWGEEDGYTIAEVAALLHISQSRVRYLTQKGVIVSERVGRIIRIPKAEVERLSGGHE